MSRKLDDAIDRGFDPHEPISAPTQAESDAFDASPWRVALDASVDFARALRAAEAVISDGTGQAKLQAELDRLYAQELADRDREWWSE